MNARDIARRFVEGSLDCYRSNADSLLVGAGLILYAIICSACLVLLLAVAPRTPPLWHPLPLLYAAISLLSTPGASCGVLYAMARSRPISRCAAVGSCFVAAVQIASFFWLGTDLHDAAEESTYPFHVGATLAASALSGAVVGSAVQALYRWASWESPASAENATRGPK